MVRLCAIWLALVAAASPLAARHRIDVVELTNGDRVTCEIVHLRSFSLHVRSLELGTIDIDWPAVARLVSPQLFEVELMDGRRVPGSFDPQPRAGQLQVHTPGGPVEHVLLTDVVAIVQLGKTLWQGGRGHLNVGLDFASSAQDLQLSVGAQLELKGPRVRSTTTLSSTVSDASEAERRVRGDLDWTGEIPAGPRWVFVGTGRVERNDDLGLTRRLSGSAAARWIAQRSVRGRWGIGAGLGASDERYGGAAGGNTIPFGLVTLTGDYDRFGAFGTHAAAGVFYLPMLGGPSRYRVEARTLVRQKVSRNFTLDLDAYYSYDSSPPQSMLAHEDWGLVSSVGWTF